MIFRLRFSAQSNGIIYKKLESSRCSCHTITELYEKYLMKPAETVQLSTATKIHWNIINLFDLGQIKLNLGVFFYVKLTICELI